MPRQDGTGPKGNGPKQGSSQGVPSRDGRGGGQNGGRGGRGGGGRGGRGGRGR